MTSILERAGVVFLELCDLTPELRAERLDQETDSELRTAVEQLLGGHDTGHAFLDGAQVEVPATEPELPAMPTSIGGFRIIGRLGEGGMGIVFEAEQPYPQRRVALKLLRATLASRDAERRFQREIQVLARLHHPGIARIFEAGVSEDGVPFFTMELVDGLSLVDHARAHGLDDRARVALVASVCDAIEHAHSRGVVHRDLKPDNVLVDTDGLPKVLDFGIAHAVLDKQVGTLQTATGMVLGTLGAMSPEQATGDKALTDARTDVYGLGALLFELLADRPPVDVRGLPIHIALHKVCEDEPTRLGLIERRFAGDLETIAQKALEKDPERRYASAAALAADLRRYLAHEPIIARPVTTFYKVTKFLRRNRILAASTLLVVATLIAATGVSLVQRKAAIDARDDAALRAAVANLQGAELALVLGEASTAERSLDGIPESLRGWEWHYLYSRLDESSLTLTLPDEPLLASFLSAGTQSRILTLTRAGDLAWWHPETLEPLGSVALGRGDVQRAVLRGDGLQLAAAFADGTVGLFDTRTGALQAELERADVSTLSIAADGERVSIRSSAGFALWRPGSGELLDLIGPRGALLFIPGRDKVLSAGPAGRLYLSPESLVDVSTDVVYRRGTAAAHFLAVTRDGSRLLAGRTDRTIEVVDLATFEALALFEGHQASISAMDFSDDGAFVASGTQNGTVRIWAADRPDAPAVFVGHGGAIASVDIEAGGARVVSASSDGTVRVWTRDNDARARVLTGHDSYVYPVAFAADGARVLSGSTDGTLRTWDAATGEALATWDSVGLVCTLAVSKVERAVVAGGWGLHLLDLDTGQSLAENGGAGSYTASVSLDDDAGILAAFLWRRGRASRIEIWDLASRSPLRGWDVSVPFYGPLVLAPGGAQLLATVGLELHRIDTTTGSLERGIEVSSRIHSIALSADGKQLATGHADGSIYMRDPVTLEVQHELHEHEGRVLALAFAPDGERLASGADDGKILLWDPRVPIRMAQLSGHENYVFSLAFSPDGRRLASGSGDTTVRIWDTATRTELSSEATRMRRARAAASPAVQELLVELDNPTAAAERLRTSTARAPLEREAALQVLTQASSSGSKD